MARHAADTQRCAVASAALQWLCCLLRGGRCTIETQRVIQYSICARRCCARPSRTSRCSCGSLARTLRCGRAQSCWMRICCLQRSSSHGRYTCVASCSYVLQHGAAFKPWPQQQHSDTQCGRPPPMRSVAASHRAVRPHTGLCFQVTAEQQHDCKQTLTPKDLMQVQCPTAPPSCESSRLSAPKRGVR